MLKNYMESSASRNVLARLAEGVGLRKRAAPRIGTTRKVTKGKPFGHYIQHHHQKLTRVMVEQPDGSYKTMYAGRESHSFLHATKGWRTFNRMLPFALQQVIMRQQATA